MNNIFLISYDSKVTFEKSQVPQNLPELFKNHLYARVKAHNVANVQIKTEAQIFLKQRNTVSECQPVLALPARKRKNSQQSMLCRSRTALLRNSCMGRGSLPQNRKGLAQGFKPTTPKYQACH